MGKSMDPELPKGQQYRQIFPDRGLSINCVPESRKSSLKDIKKEAETARREEELKEKVEAAKWRSVEQGCNYDQYRQLCLGADLKGLPPGAIENVRKEEVAPINRRTRRRGKANNAVALPERQPLPTEPPADSDEFERHWRNVSVAEPAERLQYLARFAAPLIVKLFKKGVEEYLGSILLTLEAWDGELANGAAVATWLVALPQTYRFDLAAGFLSEAENAAARQLFDRVLALEGEDCTWSPEDIEVAKGQFKL